MSDIAIISSGNAEEDSKRLKQAKTFDARLNQGICPNGCAKLEWDNPYNANCLVCGFTYSTNQPFGKRECEKVM